MVLLVLVGSLMASVDLFLRQAGILLLKPSQDNGKAPMVAFVPLTSSRGIGFGCLTA